MSIITTNQFLEACDQEDLSTIKQYIDNRLPSNPLLRFLHDLVFGYFSENQNMLTNDEVIARGLIALIKKDHLAGVYYLSDRCKILLRNIFHYAIHNTSWKIIRHVLQIYRIPDVDVSELYSFDKWALLEIAVEHSQDDIVTFIDNHMVDDDQIEYAKNRKMIGAIRGCRVNKILDMYHQSQNVFNNTLVMIIFEGQLNLMDSLMKAGFQQHIINQIITQPLDFCSLDVMKWCFKQGLFHDNYIYYLKCIITGDSAQWKKYYFAELMIELGTTPQNITEITVDIFNYFNQDIFFDYSTQRSLMILALKQGCDVNKCLWVECVPGLLKKRSARCASMLICLHHKLDKYVINKMIDRQIGYD